MRTNKKVQIIIFKNPRNPQFLLLKTDQREKSFWQGVTGGVEDTDSSIKAAAIRELSEELNISLPESQLKGPIYQFKFKSSHPTQKGTEVEEYCFYTEIFEETPFKLSHEHQEFRWLPYEQAVKTIAHDNPKIVLRKIIKLLQ